MAHSPFSEPESITSNLAKAENSVVKGDIFAGLPAEAANLAKGRLTEAISKQSSFVEGLIEQAKGKGETLTVLGLNKFGSAVEAFKEEFEKVLGAGAEALAVETKAGNVLKFSLAPLDPGMGQRMFDAPVLRHGALVGAGPEPIHYVVQPKVEIAKTAEESQRFFGELAKSGYSILDPGERQFGYYQGKPVLIDYSSVTAPHGEAEFPSRGPAKPLPAPENFRSTPGGLVREQHVELPSVPSFRRPSQESPAQSAHYQTLRETLRRESIEGKLAGAAESPLSVAKEVKPSPKLDAAVAGKVAAQETLNELHVNLESKTGQFLKKLMKLPFKKHSQVDLSQASTFAAKFFQHFAFTSRGKISVLELEDTTNVFRRIKAEGRTTGIAQFEIAGHGVAMNGQWATGLGEGKGFGLQNLVNLVGTQQEKAAVALYCCNRENFLLMAPNNLTVIHGLGVGHGGNVSINLQDKILEGRTAMVNKGGFAIAQGNTSSIYTREAIFAAIREEHGLQGWEQGTVASLFRSEDNKIRVGMVPQRPGTNIVETNKFISSSQQVPKDFYSVELSKVQRIVGMMPEAYEYGQTAEQLGVRFVTPNNQSFASIGEARTAMGRDLAVKPLNIQAAVNLPAQVSASVQTVPVSKEFALVPVKRSAKNATRMGVEVADEVARKSFKPAHIKAAGLAAAVVAGGLFLTSLMGRKNDTRQNQSTNDNTPQTTIDRGQREETLRSTTVTRKPENSPKASTKVRLTDADLNMSEVDSAFAHYFKQGFAYSS